AVQYDSIIQRWRRVHGRIERVHPVAESGQLLTDFAHRRAWVRRLHERGHHRRIRRQRYEPEARPARRRNERIRRLRRITLYAALRKRSLGRPQLNEFETRQALQPNHSRRILDPANLGLGIRPMACYDAFHPTLPSGTEVRLSL